MKDKVCGCSICCGTGFDMHGHPCKFHCKPPNVMLGEITQLREEINALKVVVVGYEKQREELIRVSEERDALEETLRLVAQSLAWHCFGECRSFGGVPVMQPHEADKLAKRALVAAAERERCAKERK